MLIRNRPFMLFVLIVGALIFAALNFIQSPQFAVLLKRAAAQRLPKDLGITADFTALSVKMFPPGIAFVEPRVLVGEPGLGPVAPGSRIEARRIELEFLPFQMLSGSIRAHRIIVSGGEIWAKLRSTAPAPKLGLPLVRSPSDTSRIQADAFGLRDTEVHLQYDNREANFHANALEVSQWAGRNSRAFEASVDLRNVGVPSAKEWGVPTLYGKILGTGRWEGKEGHFADLNIESGGVELTATGSVKETGLEATLGAHSPTASLAQWVGGNHLAEGELEYDGKIQVGFAHPLESLRVQGRVKGHDLLWQGWRAQSLELDGSYIGSNQGGELSVTKAIAESPVAERASHRVASGGKIELGAFKWRPASHEPFEVPVKFDQAQLHWLAGPASISLFQLGMRISGPAQLKVVTPDLHANAGHAAWSVRAGVDFSIADLTLDNQKFDKVRARTELFTFKQIGLKGELAFEPDGFTPENVTLTGAHSKLVVGGHYGFKSGFDLHAAGTVDLADVGKIAGNDIRGQGPLAIAVEGPLDKVRIDFDAELRQAYYLKMNFGEFRGRISWDDDPNLLVFEGIQGEQGKTSFAGGGKLDFTNGVESIAMNFDIPHGRTQDLFTMFNELTSSLWWLPSSLSGDVSGKVKLEGGYPLSKLQVSADLRGPTWDFKGERFRDVSAKVGYDRGRYYLEAGRARKQNGLLMGRISFAAEQGINWEFQTQDLLVSDSDRIARLDVPIRGKASVVSKGSGKFGAIESQTSATLTEVAVRGVSMPPSELNIKSAHGLTEVRGTALGDQGLLEMNYDANPRATSFLRAKVRHFDFSPVLLLLNPHLIQDPDLAGTISGSAELTFHAGEEERANGTVELSQYNLAKADSQFGLGAPTRVAVQNGTFDIREISLQGSRGSESTLELHGRQGQLEGAIGGNIDLSLVEFLVAPITEATGEAELDFGIGGTLFNPEISGHTTIQGGLIRAAAIEAPFENVSGTLSLRDSLVTVDRLECDLGGGRVTAGGTVRLFSDRFPRVDLRGTLGGNRIKVFPFQYARARGRITVRGDDLPYLIEGNVIVDSALSREKVLSQAQGPLLKTVLYAPPPVTRDDSGFPKFKLNVDIGAEQGIMVENDLFSDVELKGHVNLINTLDTPRITGNAEVIHGKMIFKDRTFLIQSATMQFDNPAVIDPAFNLAATTEVSGAKIQLFASGRVSHPKIELSSNNAMSESEIIQLLALGITPDDARKLRTGDRSTVEQGGAASLLLHTLDFNRDVQNKTGFEIQMDESVTNTNGTTPFRTQASSDVTAAPRILIKRKIGQKVDVTVGSTFGVGTNNQQEVNASYHLTPGFSIDGVWEGTTVTDTKPGQGRAQVSSYGLDLKLQKRFK